MITLERVIGMIMLLTFMTVVIMFMYRKLGGIKELAIVMGISLGLSALFIFGVILLTSCDPLPPDYDGQPLQVQVTDVGMVVSVNVKGYSYRLNIDVLKVQVRGDEIISSQPVVEWEKTYNMPLTKEVVLEKGRYVATVSCYLYYDDKTLIREYELTVD